MRRLPTVLLLLLLLALPACQQAPAQLAGDSSVQALPPIEVFFSPKGGCTEAVVRELTAAKFDLPRPSLQLHQYAHRCAVFSSSGN